MSVSKIQLLSSYFMCIMCTGFQILQIPTMADEIVTQILQLMSGTLVLIAVVYKLPQIYFVVSTGSTQSVSFSSISLETLAYVARDGSCA